MKKSGIAGLLCLFLAVGLLVGCSAPETPPKDEPIVCKDLALVLPGDFQQMDSQNPDPLVSAIFLFGKDTLTLKGVSVLREGDAQLMEMTLEQYTAQVISENNLSCAPEKVANGYRFTYESQADGMTYVCLTVDTAARFWTVQCYCPKKDFSKYADRITAVMDSVKPAQSRQTEGEISHEAVFDRIGLFGAYPVRADRLRQKPHAGYHFPRRSDPDAAH